MFKVSVGSLVNPPSLRGSSPFPAIYQTTVAGNRIAEYPTDAEPVVVTTDYAALFKGLGPNNIQQSHRGYSKAATYTVTFNPTNRVDASRVTLYFSYPSSVGIPVDGQGNIDIKATRPEELDG